MLRQIDARVSSAAGTRVPATPRLLYISPRFPCISLVFEQNEILGLVRTGVDLRVLACRLPTPAERNEVHPFARPLLGLAVYPSAADAIRGFGRALADRLPALARIIGWVAAAVRNPWAFPKVVGAFALALAWYRRFSNDGYDWVHADFGQNSATAALFLAELLRVPFSFKVHAFDIFDGRLALRDPLRALKLERAQVLFSEHDYGRRWLTPLLPAGASKKIVVHYSCVRTDEFQPLPPPADSVRFAALGRLVPKKGFDVLVRAVARLRQQGTEVVVDVYGDGPEYGRLKDLIEASELERSVRLLGSYENGELPRILRDAVALVVPSVTTPTGDTDGIPTVIYEAMALGRPVIASAISAIPEVVQDGMTGLLVPPADAQQLAAAMKTLLSGPDRVRSLAAEARRYTERRHDYIMGARWMIETISDD